MKTTKQTTTRSGFSIQDICSVAIMAALTAVMAQISIPMPMGVPMTMQTFAVTLAGVILGSKRGAVSMVVYLLIGSVGVPVFSNMGGGVQYLIGPTGGSRNRGKLCGRRCNVLCVDGRFGMDRNYSMRTAVYPDSRDQSRGGSDTRASGEEPACGSFADGIKMSRI